MYTRLERPTVCAGAHRSGWPWVMDQIQFSQDGMLLDDFTDATYTYRRVPGWRVDREWAGIFHHPVQIDSPIGMDHGFALRRLDRQPEFVEAKRLLRRAFAFSSEVAVDLRKWLRVPVELLKHPTDQNVPRWVPGSRRVFQVGFFLRNTRAIFQMPEVPGWVYSRSTPASHNSWIGKRDETLRRYYMGKRKRQPQIVEEYPRMCEDEYDIVMASSVVLTEIYSASANNVVIECIARDTPILVNRLKAVVEYLGTDYPLYFRDLSHAAKMLGDYSRVLAAHEYLKNMDKTWLSGEYFSRCLTSSS